MTLTTAFGLCCIYDWAIFIANTSTNKRSLAMGWEIDQLWNWIAIYASIAKMRKNNAVKYMHTNDAVIYLAHTHSHTHMHTGNAVFPYFPRAVGVCVSDYKQLDAAFNANIAACSGARNAKEKRINVLACPFFPSILLLLLRAMSFVFFCTCVHLLRAFISIQPNNKA